MKGEEQLLTHSSGHDKECFWRDLVEFFIPRCCPLCKIPVGDSRRFFCQACEDDFSFIEPPLCPLCGTPFKSPEQHSHPCQSCLEGAWRFDRGFSVFYYHGTLRRAIHLFKYSGRVILANALARFLHERGAFWMTEIQPEVIVPVPSHGRRLKKRGFNPPLFLARYLGRRLRIPVLTEALLAIKQIPSQAGLKREERLENVQGAFMAERNQVRGRRVLLIDDVLTTGATANECARALKKAGASYVAVMTLARSVDWDLRT
jgi:ComF family protein